MHTARVIRRRKTVNIAATSSHAVIAGHEIFPLSVGAAGSRKILLGAGGAGACGWCLHRRAGRRWRLRVRKRIAAFKIAAVSPEVVLVLIELNVVSFA